MGFVLETRSIDPLGFVTKTRTDRGGRTLETYDQEGQKSTAQYDASGNILQRRDPNSVGIDSIFDQLGRQTSQTDTFGTTMSQVHDKAGNVTKQFDGKGSFALITYDALNRKKTITDRLNGVTTYGYAPTGQLASLTDAENQSTTYSYNDRGEKISETHPDHVPNSAVGTSGYGIVSFSYDPAGRTKVKTDQTGDTCTFNFDLANHMVQRDYRLAANSPSGAIADSDTFIFDRADRMLTANSGRYNNQVGMGYDFGGRLSSESLTIAGQAYSVNRTYDVRSLDATITYPNGSIVERTYSPRGQLQTVKYLGTVVDTRTYDLGRRLNTNTYANGAVTTRNYRTDNLLNSIATTHGGTQQIGTYSYTWDANKNKTGETITGTMSGYGFTVPSNGYDSEDRVTVWNRTDGLKNQSWNLSLVGDWNSHTDAGVSQTRTHGLTHEFAAVTIAGNNSPINYDVKGNMLTRPTSLQSPALNLVWDFDNQLKGADNNGTPASLEVAFEYDALNRRVASNASSGNQVFARVGDQVVVDYARGVASASPTNRYVFGDYVDEPIIRHAGLLTTVPTSGTDLLYYHSNQQQSIVGLTDATGNLVERYSYTAHGGLGIFDAAGTVRGTSLFANRQTYTGREWEDSLKVYDFRARWFDPASGRFLGRDPSGFVDGPSLYQGYFALKSLDPSGRMLNDDRVDDPAGIHYGTICAIAMRDKNGKVNKRWLDDAKKAGHHVLEGAQTAEDIFNFVFKHRCCTVYTFGHQGGDDNPGGTISHGEWIEEETGWAPRKTIFPNAAWELQLGWLFDNLGCSDCAINIVACGGTSDAHRKTRQDIADRTGCVVCGSNSKCVCGGTEPDPENPNDPCVTVGTPTGQQIPWPFECESPIGKNVIPNSY